MVRVDEEVAATADVAGGPIRLAHVALSGVAEDGTTSQSARVGAELHLVLYWLADAPVDESYTVFTQLLNPAGLLVAQQDNLPVEGLAPTNSWQPNTIIRDPYRLTIPADAAPGAYQLLIGLYTDAGRRQLTLADGTQSDHLSLTVNIQ